MEATITYRGVVYSQGPLHWGLEDIDLREVKTPVENFVIEDDVPTKTASLKGKKIKLTKSFFLVPLTILVARRYLSSIMSIYR